MSKNTKTGNEHKTKLFKRCLKIYTIYIVKCVAFLFLFCFGFFIVVLCLFVFCLFVVFFFFYFCLVYIYCKIFLTCVKPVITKGVMVSGNRRMLIVDKETNTFSALR